VRIERFATFLLVLCSLAAPIASAADRERILLPLLVPPVFGAHGSEFRTALTIHNTSDRVVALFGIREECEVCLPEDISGNGVELASAVGCPVSWQLLQSSTRSVGPAFTPGTAMRPTIRARERGRQRRPVLPPAFAGWTWAPG
jgi:hypothetical protein